MSRARGGHDIADLGGYFITSLCLGFRKVQDQALAQQFIILLTIRLFFMPVFLIPIAIVGYNMWEKHRAGQQAELENRASSDENGHLVENSLVQKETERERQGSPGEEDSLLIKSNPEHASVQASTSVRTDARSPRRPSGPFGGIKAFFEERQRRSERESTDVVISSIEKDNLAYDVMGSQGSNGMPLPQICAK